MDKIAISLFSGVGGLDLGFRFGNYKIPIAIEYDKQTAYSYAQNFGCRIINTNTDIDKLQKNIPVIICDDIKKITGNFILSILKKTTNRKDIDILLGGPSCQSWSLAGKQKGLEDIRGQNILEYFRLLKELKPKSFIFENVKGLISNKFKKIFDNLINEFKHLQYNVQYKLINSCDFGLAQKRERIFVIGTTTTEYRFPIPIKDNVSLRTTIENLELPLIATKELLKNYKVPNNIINIIGENHSKYYIQDKITLFKRNKTNLNHFYKPYKEEKLNLLKLVPEGGNWKDIDETLAKKYLGKAFYSTGGKTGFLRKLSMSKSSPTILTSVNQKFTEFCMPTETPRPLTVRECLRLQGFPDWFIVYGSLSSQYKQVGNAVPPILAYYLCKQFK